MNRTKIEWCDYSWNPITGCSQQGCSVGKDCYAYKMAQRLRGRFGYPKDYPFRVTFHPERLNEPCKIKKPSKIFVCSMGEMYDCQSKYGWLGLIFATMKRCPQHIFLSLTKQPDSLIPILPKNLGFGVSVTGINDEWRIDRLKEIDAEMLFISFEPLKGPINFDNHSLVDVDWVIVGKLTGAKRTFDMGWVMDISAECNRLKIPIFLKNNLGLKNPIQEFPSFLWEKNAMKICHLILKHKYYDLIDSGKKTIEYRDNTPYWRKRILDADAVTLHRGYTNTTMTFMIKFKVPKEKQIEIHLGGRLNILERIK